MRKAGLLVLTFILCGIWSVPVAAEENPSAGLSAPIASDETYQQGQIWTQEDPAVNFLEEGDSEEVMAPNSAESDAVPMVGNGYVSGTIVPYENAKYSLQYRGYEGEVTISGCIGDDTAASWGDLVIPNQIEGMPVTFIGNNVFMNCTAFDGILTLPKSLKQIGRYAFSGCSSLSGGLELPEELEYIGDGAFRDCSGFAGSLVLPKGLESIGDNTFSFCDGFGGSLTLPKGLKNIGKYAFRDCNNLTELIMPDGVTDIGESAFMECDSLINVSIPSSVTSIGKAAFDDCNGLAHIYYGGSKEQWDSVLNRENGTEFIDAATIHYNSYYTSDNMPPAFTDSATPVTVITPSAYNAPAPSDNQDAQEYVYYSARPINSYLYDNGNGLTRVEYTGGVVIIENYDSNLRHQSGWVLQPELPEWGGFYAGEKYNFLIFGQDNTAEDDSVEVIRVVKYDKDWNRLDHASLKGANTTGTFDAGSLRCDEYGGMLYVRTCHVMYTSQNDGLRHQANLTFSVRQADMKITDGFWDVGNIGGGYVSHSFNQFIMVDEEGNIVALDHGDAYPRAAVLVRYFTKAGRNRFIKQHLVSTEESSEGWTVSYYAATENVNLYAFPGRTGDNATGASLGGLAETESGYIAAFNYSFNSGFYSTRNIHIAYLPKDSFAEESVRIWTDPAAIGYTPVLASTGLDGGYVLWKNPNEDSSVQYVRYDAQGNVSQVQNSSNVLLSDCQPIPYRGNMIWYVTNGDGLKFYTLNGGGISVIDPTRADHPFEVQDPEKVRSFVSRMYTVALGRDAEEAGLNDWTNRLLTHEVDGAGIANGFIMSDEFSNKNVTDETYVDILYHTFFNRDADEGGRADWLARLSNGNSRIFVLAGFVNSVEFDSLCSEYGITRGTMQTNETAIGPGVRQFVNRCYIKVLKREGEETGVSDWIGRIARGEETPESVAKLFFFSEEYANKETGDEEFVETLYQTFMDRASDPAGKADWVGRLAGGTSRQDVLEGFSRSEEFAKILESFGL